MTYQELIQNALLLCGKGYEGQVVSGQTLVTAINKLNNIFGEWEGEQHGTWNETEHKFCLTAGKPSYTVGISSDIDIARVVNIIEVRTKQISGAVTYKGTTTIATFLALSSGTEGDYYEFTDSNSDINIGDYGVLNTDISSLITSDDYDIVTDSGVYIDLSEYKKYDFQRLPNKQGQGTPVIYHYDPDNIIGTLYLWRTGSSGQQILFTAYHGWDTVTTANVTNSIDFPKSWQSALEYRLAAELGYIYGTQPDKLDRIETKASYFLDKAIGSNDTEGSFYFYADTTN